MQWLMLQQESPEDFVIATGQQYSVRQFSIWAAAELGLKLAFNGTGVAETAIVRAKIGNRAPAIKVGDTILRVDPRYYRPAEVETLLGDPSRARLRFGWEPTITAQELCAEIMAEDFRAAQRDLLQPPRGLKPDRKLEETLQHQATTQCSGLQPNCSEAIIPMEPRPIMH